MSFLPRGFQGGATITTRENCNEVKKNIHMKIKRIKPSFLHLIYYNIVNICLAITL